MTLRHDFPNRHALAVALAASVADALSHSISATGQAVLAVSGGTTPAVFFTHLSQAAITWNKVTVTVVDERQVDETSDRSNARLVRRGLLQNAAAAARFVPLYGNVKKASALVPDVVVLGMGEDGHTASFFPQGDTLQAALDPATTSGLITLTAPGAGEPRLTFTLARLLQSRRQFLHIEGAAKQAVLARAEGQGSVSDMPVRAVLRQAPRLEIFWSP